MAQPKRRWSKARTGLRRSTWKLENKIYAECPNCKEKILPHKACPTCGQYNKRQTVEIKVKEAASGIDVYLKQRFDLIPNIVETVKGYAKYEKEVLDNIIQIRSSYENIQKENIEGISEINNKYTKMLAIVEAYPELKANESFLKLQKILSKIESQLQAARRIYNSEVTIYNINIMSFPKNIIAKIFGFKVEKLFEMEVIERENIEVKV